MLGLFLRNSFRQIIEEVIDNLLLESFSLLRGRRWRLKLLLLGVWCSPKTFEQIFTFSRAHLLHLLLKLTLLHREEVLRLGLGLYFGHFGVSSQRLLFALRLIGLLLRTPRRELAKELTWVL